MKTNKNTIVIYRVSEYIVDIVYINILWVLFSVLGIGILGVFPATISMFTVFRKMEQGKEGFSIFKLYWKTYFKEFKHINLLGYSFLILTIMLYIDVNYFFGIEKFVYVIMGFFLTIALVIIVLAFTISFPLYAHYHLSYLNYIKQSFMIVLRYPFIALSILVLTLPVNVLNIYLPGFLILFGISLNALVVTKIMYLLFKRISKERIS